MLSKSTLGIALAAAATSACAQSSVTLSGIVDAGYSYGKGNLSHINQLTSGNNATSRFWIRGQEDLGGGLAASFWLESQFAADTGLGATSNTNNQTTGAPAAPVGGQGLTFNRRATVALSGPLGEFRLGRDAAAQFYDRFESDPFAAVGVGATQAFVSSLAGPASIRVSNAVSYFLPGGLNGIFGQAQYFFGENQSNVANKNDGSGYNLRLGWSNQALRFTAVRARSAYATGNIVTTLLTGSYSVSAARVLLGVFNDRVEQPSRNTGKGYTLGTVIPFGPGEVKAALSRYSTDAGASPATSKIALGYVYSLSKRTVLYGTLAHVKNSGGANRALNTALTGANQGSSGFDIGMRHSF